MGITNCCAVLLCVISYLFDYFMSGHHLHVLDVLILWTYLKGFIVMFDLCSNSLNARQFLPRGENKSNLNLKLEQAFKKTQKSVPFFLFLFFCLTIKWNNTSSECSVKVCFHRENFPHEQEPLDKLSFLFLIVLDFRENLIYCRLWIIFLPWKVTIVLLMC